MAVQAFRNLIPRGELLGVAALVIIGIALCCVLAPANAVRRAGIPQPVRKLAFLESADPTFLS